MHCAGCSDALPSHRINPFFERQRNWMSCGEAYNIQYILCILSRNDGVEAVYQCWFGFFPYIFALHTLRLSHPAPSQFTFRRRTRAWAWLKKVWHWLVFLSAENKYPSTNNRNIYSFQSALSSSALFEISYKYSGLGDGGVKQTITWISNSMPTKIGIQIYHLIDSGYRDMDIPVGNFHCCHITIERKQYQITEDSQYIRVLRICLPITSLADGQRMGHDSERNVWYISAIFFGWAVGCDNDATDSDGICTAGHRRCKRRDWHVATAQIAWNGEGAKKMFGQQLVGSKSPRQNWCSFEFSCFVVSLLLSLEFSDGAS